MLVEFKNIPNSQMTKSLSDSFTLIEMMVSISIIIMVIISAIGIYMYVIGPQQKITATADLQQDGQWIMNLIAKDIRANQVDYDAYGGIISSGGVAYLYLVNNVGDEKITYRACNSNNNDCQGGQGCVLKKKTGSSAATSCTDSDLKQISMTDVNIETFKLYIVPTEDPFTSGATSFQNPKVTVVLELKSYKERVGERRVKLQQTIPQRHQEKRYY